MTDDLFEKFPDHAMTPMERKRLLGGASKRTKRPYKPTLKKGYVGIPGTSPKGETCGSCEHCVNRGGVAGRFKKCALNKANWTGGAGSDILMKTAACSRWAAKQPEEK